MNGRSWLYEVSTEIPHQHKGMPFFCRDVEQGFSLRPPLTFWDTQSFLVGRAFLCVIRCLASSLNSTPQVPATAPPLGVTTKNLSRYCPKPPGMGRRNNPWLKTTNRRSICKRTAWCVGDGPGNGIKSWFSEMSYLTPVFLFSNCPREISKYLFALWSLARLDHLAERVNQKEADYSYRDQEERPLM